jgi:hypothetical protein
MSGRKQGLYWYAGLQFSVKFLQSTSSLARSLSPSVVLRGLLSVSVVWRRIRFFFGRGRRSGRNRRRRRRSLGVFRRWVCILE